MESENIVIDDGNGLVLASQEIMYTDFPIDEIVLYGCWENEIWVLMLPSKYWVSGFKSWIWELITWQLRFLIEITSDFPT